MAEIYHDDEKKIYNFDFDNLYHEWSLEREAVGKNEVVGSLYNDKGL